MEDHRRPRGPWGPLTGTGWGRRLLPSLRLKPLADDAHASPRKDGGPQKGFRLAPEALPRQSSCLEPRSRRPLLVKPQKAEPPILLSYSRTQWPWAVSSAPLRCLVTCGVTSGMSESVHSHPLISPLSCDVDWQEEERIRDSRTCCFILNDLGNQTGILKFTPDQLSSQNTAALVSSRCGWVVCIN